VAHPSIMPHEHPHATSILPAIAVLLMATVAVGVGTLVIEITQRAKK